MNERLQALRNQQADAAASIQAKISHILTTEGEANNQEPSVVTYDPALDPQPLLKLRTEDKALPQVEEKAFLEDLVIAIAIISHHADTNNDRLMSDERFRNLATSPHRVNLMMRSHWRTNQKRLRR